MSATSIILEAMREAARVAGLEIRGYYHADGASDRRVASLAVKNGEGARSEGNLSDIVTECDGRAEHLIKTHLEASVSEKHKYIGEESGAANEELGDEPTFIIDPIDGTTNFSRCIPFCCILIARAVKRRVDLAVVLDPVRCEMYTAIRGGGAYLWTLDPRTLRPVPSVPATKLSVGGTSSSPPLNECVLFTDVGYKRSKKEASEFGAQLANLLSRGKVRGLRVMGSCGLGMVYVARGLCDIYFETHGPMVWDFAASGLIVEEAGGVVRNPLTRGELNLRVDRSVVAARNERLLGEVCDLMAVGIDDDDDEATPKKKPRMTTS